METDTNTQNFSLDKIHFAHYKQTKEETNLPETRKKQRSSKNIQYKQMEEATKMEDNS